MAKKKTVVKKKTATRSSARKTQPVAKKKTSTATKKAVAKKKTPAKKTPSKFVSTKVKGLDMTQRFLSAKTSAGSQPSTRRPPNNPDMPDVTIQQLNEMLIQMRTILDDYSQHLRALDRKRLNGVGIRTLGFIERSFEFASENQDFLPHYLTLERFDSKDQAFWYKI